MRVPSWSRRRLRLLMAQYEMLEDPRNSSLLGGLQAQLELLRGKREALELAPKDLEQPYLTAKKTFQDSADLCHRWLEGRADRSSLELLGELGRTKRSAETLRFLGACAMLEAAPKLKPQLLGPLRSRLRQHEKQLQTELNICRQRLDELK